MPDGFRPVQDGRDKTSHESLCLLNTSARDATLVFGAFFADRDPVFSEPVILGARRAVHYRTDDPGRIGGLVIPAGIPYGLTLTADVAVSAQYSRLDTSNGYTLMTTIPYCSTPA